MSKFIHEAATTRKRSSDYFSSEVNKPEVKASAPSQSRKKAKTLAATSSDSNTTNGKKVGKASAFIGKNDDAVTDNSKKVAKAKKDNKIQNKKTSSSNEVSKIIYLGHLPDGFYEAEMKKYFSQYGKVKQVKLFRSAKTNRSKGYAFLEFLDEGVAEVAAESMNGYLMFQKTLVCHVVPKEKCHSGMFLPPKSKAKKSTDKPTEESKKVTETTKTKTVEKSQSESESESEEQEVEDVAEKKKPKRGAGKEKAAKVESKQTKKAK